MRHVKQRRAVSACHDLADLAKQEPHDFGVRVFSVPRDHEVVAPSLTPESYNLKREGYKRNGVVAPSLTPESYNTQCQQANHQAVVAPSLTPESYNY